MNKVYVLRVSGGDYDHWEVAIKAYSSKAIADNHCAEAIEYYDQFTTLLQGKDYWELENPPVFNSPHPVSAVSYYHSDIVYDVYELDFYL